MNENNSLYVGLILMVGLCFSVNSLHAGEKAKKDRKVEDRQLLMREMSGTIKDLEAAIFKGESDKDRQSILEHAELLKNLSAQIEKKFEDKEMSDKAQAKSSVWSDKKKFDKAAGILNEKVDEFIRAVKSNDQKTIQKAYSKLDMKSVCTQCHATYRKGDKGRGVP